MSSAGSASGTDVYVEVDASAFVSPLVTAATLTSTEQIALYLHDDLYKLVIEAGVNLPDALGLEAELGEDPKELVSMICDDVERMLRRQLIDGAEILLSDPVAGPGNVRKVRYRVQYTITNQRTLDPNERTRWGGEIRTIPQTFPNAFFTFGVKFRAGVPAERRSEAHRPYYLFDWVPEGASYDGTGLVRFQVGGMNTADQAVRRVLFTDVSHLGTS